ncbi:MAG: GNAT family N-acetyltransferase [Eubacterium sp.]|nr:GNAT family N-acetyltransferase [Eubacterium sp.]
MKNTGTVTLHTARLTLRKIRLSDYFVMRRWYCNPALGRYSQKNSVNTRGDCIDFILRRVYNYYFKRRLNYYAWAIVLDGKMIGFVVLNGGEKDLYAIYYMLSEAHQRQGYVKEAVTAVLAYMKTQRCRAIFGNCDSNNLASASILEATGFRFYKKVDNYYHYPDGRTGDRLRFVYKLKEKRND